MPHEELRAGYLREGPRMGWREGTPRRLEGRSKVTGGARYAGDLSGSAMDMLMDVAVAVTSTQSSGAVTSIDAEAALACPGVRCVMTHENAPRLRKVTARNGAEVGELLPLQDDRIRYGGQIVAVVVAETLAAAEAAALLVKVTYSAPEAHRAFTLDQGSDRAKKAKKTGAGTPGEQKVGDATKAFEAAAHKVDMSFSTAPLHHNAMEPGAAVAAWDAGGGLTVHLPTQFSYGDAVILGEAFGFGLKDRMPRMIGQMVAGLEFDNKVRVISTLTGGGFGGKSGGNIHLLLAPMAAKLNGRAVKLVLDREQTFSLMPFRGETRQRVRLGAGADGRLTALIHEGVVAKGIAGQFIEPAGENSAKLYNCPNIYVNVEAAALDTNAPGWMRGPGVQVAHFAIESALDVLAEQLEIDPLEMRLINYADVQPDNGHEWSSKSLKECYLRGAKAIGWFERDPKIGAMREGRHRVGLGMATAAYPTLGMPAVARITLGVDGKAVVQSAAHEIGQGMITALTQIGAEQLGLALDDVTLNWGDTSLPFGGTTVGSMTTLSVGAAVAAAATKLKADLCKRVVKMQGSPLHRARPKDLEIRSGRILDVDGSGLSVREAMAKIAEPIEAEGITRTTGKSKYGRYAFGAQYAKVLIDEDTGHIQVQRLVGAFAGGRAINPMLVKSQLIGGMVWGLGQALIEGSYIDPRMGLWMNASLGEALVPVNADVAEVDAIIVEEDDTRGHPLGVKGMGEIGTVGVMAAIANAIHHATGKRLTTTPMQVQHLLD